MKITTAQPPTPNQPTPTQLAWPAKLATLTARSAPQAVKVAPLSSPQAFSAVLASLGLPADRLSAAIVSFAKFFSLPLDPALLAKVRRQAMTAGQPPLPGQGAAAGKANAAGNAAGLSAEALQRGREALSLAALAAADKGVELTPAGLEDYAAAIDPERRDGQGGGNNGERPKKRQDRRQDEEEAEAITGDVRRLKARVSGAAEKNPLLDLLNRRSGKNGRRWIVFPFDFTENEDQYRVSLRILVDENPAADSAGRMAGHAALEIVRAADSAAQERRWLFVLDSDRRSDDRGKIARLEALLWPPRPDRALQALARDLSARMALPAECISVQNAGEFISFAAENREELLLSINKEV